MAKIFYLSKEPKEPWYRSVFAKIGGIIIFCAALFGMLNDGCTYLDRWLPTNQSTSKSVPEEIDEEVVVNSKPLTITYGRSLDIHEQNAKPYTFEFETTGSTILIEDSIKLVEVQIKDRRIENTEHFGKPSVQLISNELDSKLLNKEQKKTTIKLLLKINFYTNAQIVTMSTRTEVYNIGYIVVAIPYRIKKLVKWKNQQIPVILEVLPY